MNYTRLFFNTIASLIAIVVSLWAAVIIAFVFVFVVYFFTDYMMNPWLPIGLFIIYALFKKDGAIEQAINNSKK
ncbi:hypothetical protein [Enterococcus mundtii]|uniref:hypothetical protein n=1 Tax=Enterococcus mundtii TaxID=53346 RepID=UPI001A96BA29|nr:hypothetical protein [Enterococcus mundtii]MBO1087150.1 hypothetical protein [Enterococcus mundtii]